MSILVLDEPIWYVRSVRQRLDGCTNQHIDPHVARWEARSETILVVKLVVLVMIVFPVA
jgi:hypothetical protein